MVKPSNPWLWASWSAHRVMRCDVAARPLVALLLTECNLALSGVEVHTRRWVRACDLGYAPRAYAAGVVPRKRRKWRVRCGWSWNPTVTATSAAGRPASSIRRARSSRRPVR